MEVTPVGWSDQALPLNNIRTRVFFVVYESLDEKKLRSALDLLIRSHWRRLGGRLVANSESGRLEYHVPRSFDDSHVLFKWSSAQVDTKVPLPSSNPSGHSISLHDSAGALTRPFVPEDWPLERKHETADAPLLWIHVSRFTDATVLGLNVPHLVADQIGVALIIKAWLGLAAGREPLTLLDVKDEQIERPNDKELTQSQTPGLLRLLTKWEIFRQMLNLAPDIILNPTEVVHSIFIPFTLVQALFHRCKKDLKASYGEDVFITEGDVVAAVLIKFSQLHRKHKHMLHFYQAINLRGRVQYLPKDCAYIHNALMFGAARFPASRETPLAEYARQHRLAVVYGLEPRNIEVFQAVHREHSRQKRMVLINEPGERSFHVTSWAGAWCDIDFASVVSNKPMHRTGADESAPLKMLVLGQSRETSNIHRFDSQIMCKTEEGYWCNFGASSKTMKLVEKYLKESPQLDDDFGEKSQDILDSFLTLRVFTLVVILGYLIYRIR